jgi:serine/threonine-protein kinase
MNEVDQPMLRSLGKYRIDGILGQGAMGVVYKGYDTVIERFVALKTIRAELLDRDDGMDWLDRFKQEVRAVGRCLHANIVTVFEYGEDHGIPYIAMEYIQGLPLNQLLRQEGCLAVHAALPIMRQVLGALDCAHHAGVIHRDIKPENIILLANQQVKVTDFGIARLDSVSSTQYGIALGTPAYMAPEQFLGGPVSATTDIYAAGAVLFELLTGQKLLTARTTVEILEQFRSGYEPASRVELEMMLPPAVRVLLCKAVAAVSAERFETARAFADALVQALPELGRDRPLLTHSDTVFLPDDSPPVAPTDPGSRWAANALQEVEKQLTIYLGPVARVLVKKTAQQMAGGDDLYQRLAQHIGDEQARHRFLEAVKQPDSSGRTRTDTITNATSQTLAGSLSLNDQQLTEVIRLLTVHLGPIARVLVRKAANRGATQQEFYEHLSKHIPDAAGRIIFLRSCAKLAKR